MPQRPWDTTKQTSVCVRGVPEGEERNGQKEIFKEKMAKSFPHLRKNNLTHPRSTMNEVQ